MHFSYGASRSTGSCASLAFASPDRVYRWPKAALCSGQPGKGDGGGKRGGALRGGIGNPGRGLELLKTGCGKCHTLFDEGGRVGPDLTGYERDNLDFMLPAIVDPSLGIRRDVEGDLYLDPAV